MSENFADIIKSGRTTKAGWNLPTVGDIVMCTVVGEEPGGYTLSVAGRDVLAFLAFSKTLEVGQELPVAVVVPYKEKWLVTLPPTKKQSTAEPDVAD